MVRYQRPPFATARARAMRRKSTEAESKLWLLLRDRRLGAAKFRRQFPIGSYIADFVCLGRKLVVEADGSQHAESATDAVRDQWFAREGYVVLRYSNNGILKNPDGVLMDIMLRLENPPHPVAARFARLDRPLPRRGEGKKRIPLKMQN